MASLETPLLIYDGDCSFCKFWVEYWKSVIGDRISYAPYQDVAHQFPQIPIEEFQRALQFIDRQGEISSGAEAVFRSLAYAPEKAWLLWCHSHVPGIAAVSNRAYQFIARHRGPLYPVMRLLWGKRLERARFALTRSISMRLVGVIYLLAFASWLPQVRGLIGSDGILPARSFLSGAHQELGARAYFLLPTLAWLHPTDAFLQALSAAGIALSLPVIFGIAAGPSLLLLWIIYLSQVSIGRDFMAFQWDILLLEAGFLAIFFSSWTGSAGVPPAKVQTEVWRARRPRSQPAPSVVMVWLFRWLVFRVFFLSAVVKLQSGDPTWRNLTALSFHYQTQPLPNVVAWYLFQLPLWFQKASTAFALGVELLVPFCIFAPRRLRFGAAYLLLFLQALIFLTGNYCFFNLLTIVLCLLLFDDGFFTNFLPQLRVGATRRVAPVRERLRARAEAIKSPAPRSKRSRAAIGILAAVLVMMSVFRIAERFDMSVPRTAGWILGATEPFYITNSYGLFAVMTTTRPEIIMEGSNDGERWLAYDFKYKPGNLMKPPSWAAPHQPRLDWQMWFAALGNYRNNPWFVNFAVRLLQDSPEVVALLADNPFADRPPRYIRAMIYDYQFTTPGERKATGNWWKRELLGTYLPPVSLNKSQ